jgi:nucleoside-diphosphate-sugar epimerase
VLAGSDRPLIISSGTGLVAPGRLATEDDIAASGPESLPRVASEEAAVSVAARGVRVSVVRLPLVHGEGDHGFLAYLIAIAREKGKSAYVGDGTNRWPAVHRFDAARLYRLALEKGEAGARYHAVDEEGVLFRQIAGVIGRRLDVPVVGITSEDAAGHFGWFAQFPGRGSIASSEKTRAALGWQPREPGLIADLDRASYFEG